MFMTILRTIGYIMRLSFRITFWLGLIPFRVIGYLTHCALWLRGQHALSWLRDCAVISIAVTALVVSFSQGEQQRTHDRLSVRPILQFSRYMAPIPGRSQLGVFLKNVGAGIAEIDKFNICLVGVKENTVPDCSNSLKIVIDKIRAEHPDFPLSDIHYYARMAGALAPDTELALFTVDASLRTSDWWWVWLDYISRMTIHIEYTSLYNERFVADLPQITLKFN